MNKNFNHDDEVNSDKHSDQYHAQPHPPSEYESKNIAQTSRHPRQHPVSTGYTTSEDTDDSDDEDDILVRYFGPNIIPTAGDVNAAPDVQDAVVENPVVIDNGDNGEAPVAVNLQLRTPPRFPVDAQGGRTPAGRGRGRPRGGGRRVPPPALPIPADFVSDDSDVSEENAKDHTTDGVMSAGDEGESGEDTDNPVAELRRSARNGGKEQRYLQDETVGEASEGSE